MVLDHAGFTVNIILLGDVEGDGMKQGSEVPFLPIKAGRE
jgi:hypothetical protein